MKRPAIVWTLAACALVLATSALTALLTLFVFRVAPPAPATEAGGAAVSPETSVQPSPVAAAVVVATGKPVSPAPAPVSPAVRAAPAAAGSSDSLEIIDAIWGDVSSKEVKDVTRDIAARVKDGRLDMKVDPDAMGWPRSTIRARKTLTIMYKLGGTKKTERFPEGTQIWLSTRSQEQVRWEQKLAELRLKQPTGLVIIEATFGSGNRVADVTDMLRKLVKEDSLTVPATVEALGDPAPSINKRLRVTFHDGATLKTEDVGERIVLQIGPKRRPIVAQGAQIVDLDARLAELRKRYPTGIVVMSARYGTGNQWTDLTERVQGVVDGDSMTVPINDDALGNPAPGSVGRLFEITYYDGKEFKTEARSAMTTFQVGPKRTAVTNLKGGLLNLEKRLAELREKYPTGIVVLQARYGEGNRWADVTDRVQSAVWGDSMTVPIDDGAFGNPAPGAVGRTFQITYYDGKEFKDETHGAMKTLQVGPKRTAVVAIGGGLVNLEKRLSELRVKYPTGVVVLQARYGEGNRWFDVTEKVQNAAAGDSLTVPIGDDALGNPAPGSASRAFEITYYDGTEFKTQSLGSGALLQVGPNRTAMVPMRGGLLNLDRALKELRKTYPTGIVVVEARYGVGPGWTDVTEKVQRLVKSDGLTVPAGPGLFGDPSPGESGKTLVTTYHDGQRFVTVQTPEGGTLQVNRRTTAVVDAGGRPLNIPDRVDALRRVLGEGLIILDAQWGTGNRWADVRELIQAEVADNELSTTVGRYWPNPAPYSSGKTVKISYWNGNQIKTIEAADGMLLELKGFRPEALSALRPLPQIALEGQSLTHPFEADGRFAPLALPKGALLSDEGVFTWTPSADQVGMQEVRFSFTVADKTYMEVAHVEVVSRVTARLLSGNEIPRPAQVEAALRLRLSPSSGGCEYSPGKDFKSGLILCGSELTVVNADGITVLQQGKLPKPYLRIADREQYYVAMCNEPKGIDLLDKRTLRILRSIKLPFYSVTDLAIHPVLRLSYVGVEQTGDGASARYSVVVVDEARGEARQPEYLIGRYLAIDPTGTWLYSGFKDVHRRGTRYFMTPDGRIWDTPVYRNMEIMLKYSLTNPFQPKLEAFKENVGGNGSGLKLSPDGRRLTYLSQAGYPINSGSIPGWDPGDLDKLPITYECKGKAPSTALAYHPTLPVVAMPGSEGPVFFHRESGDEQRDRVRIAQGVLDGVRVHDVYFSPDGLSAILKCQRGVKWWLYRLPLVLSARERDIAGKGITVPPAKPQRGKPPIDQSVHVPSGTRDGRT